MNSILKPISIDFVLQFQYVYVTFHEDVPKTYLKKKLGHSFFLFGDVKAMFANLQYWKSQNYNQIEITNNNGMKFGIRNKDFVINLEY